MNSEFQNEAGKNIRFKQRAVIEFLTAEGAAPTDFHRRMVTIYGNQTVDVCTVRLWARTCQEGDPGSSDLGDKPRRGRPRKATDESHQERIDELIRGNRGSKQSEIAAKSASQKNAFVT